MRQGIPQVYNSISEEILEFCCIYPNLRKFIRVRSGGGSLLDKIDKSVGSG